jgi:hypothetical protein
MSAENVEYLAVDRDQEFERYADQPLQDEIARMVENTNFRDGCVLPVEQEDMTKVYDRLGNMSAPVVENGSDHDLEGACGLYLEDIFCEYIKGGRL